MTLWRETLESARPRLAIVEDDPDQRDSMQEYLELHDYAVWAEHSAESFYRRLHLSPADIIILDIGLPGENGLEVAEYVAQLGMGIIIVSAYSSLSDRLHGLRAGADTYLVKPINMSELAAQVEAIWRRLQKGGAEDVQQAVRGAWVLLQYSRELRAPCGICVAVTPSEFVLLRGLARNGGSMSRSDVARVLDRNPEHFNFHRIDVLLTRLRKKVKNALGRTLPIASVPPQRLELTSPLLLD